MSSPDEYQEFVSLMREVVLSQRALTLALHELAASNMALAEAVAQQDEAPEDEAPPPMSRKR